MLHKEINLIQKNNLLIQSTIYKYLNVRYSCGEIFDADRSNERTES